MSSERVRKGEGQFSSASDAAQRLEAIVKAAEQAASKVIDDAEEEARRRIDEAHVRADRIVAERLRDLAELLDPSNNGVRHEPISSDSHDLRLRAVEATAEDDGRESDPAIPAQEEPPTPRRDADAGARLLATQMAVSGATREEIAARLRNGFEIEDTDAILDAILGPQ